MSSNSRDHSDRFAELRERESLSLGEVQALSFAGVPDRHRPFVWMLLLGYLPLRRSLRAARLARARAQYAEFLRETQAKEPPPPGAPAASSSLPPAADDPLPDGGAGAGGAGSGAGAGATPPPSPSQQPSLPEASVPQWEADAALQAEIAKDIERTNPELNWFNKEEHLLPMRRILFVYAKLNSGVRYVQGMNEILAPLWFVLANDRARREEEAAAAAAFALTSASASAGAPAASMVTAAAQAAAEAARAARLLAEAEADAFFCFMALMAEIRELFIQAHDNGELGVRGMLVRFQRLLARREPAVAEHFRLANLSPDFYAFRWVTTLLTREFAFRESRAKHEPSGPTAAPNSPDRKPPPAAPTAPIPRDLTPRPTQRR